jgi:hypothetical protein
MQAGLPQIFKCECLYYVKHLADHFTFRQVLSYCSKDNQQLFRGEKESSRRRQLTRYIENVKRSPQAYKEELHRVSPTEAPVIAAVHQLLQNRFPDHFINVMSSDSSSPDSRSSSSSSSFDVTPPVRTRTVRFDVTPPARTRTTRRSSSDPAALLSEGFARLSVDKNKRSPPRKPATNKALV